MRLPGKLTAALAAAVMFGTALPAAASASEYEYIGTDAVTERTLAADSTAPASAPKPKIAKSYGKVRLSWNKVANAEKYYIYKMKSDGTFKKVLSTTKCAVVIKDIPENTQQTYKITAVKGNKGRSVKVKFRCAPMQIIRLPYDTYAYTNSSCTEQVPVRSGYYTGYCDNISFKDYYVIYARTSRYLVKRSSAQIVNNSGKILSCGAMSQLDGKICNAFACGPATVAEFISAVTGKALTVEEAITDAQKYNVTIYSDPSFRKDGMPAKGVGELISAELKKNGIKDKKLHTVKIGNSSAAKISKDLKSLIDRGCRVVVSTRDDSTNTSGRTIQGYAETGSSHYTVVTGYDTSSDGTLWFYTANVWYYESDDYEYALSTGYRNRSSARYYFGLCRSTADVLSRSIVATARSDSDFNLYFYVE